jgi:hypothetical protein
VLEWPLALADQCLLVGAAPSLSGPSIRDIGRSVARYFTGRLSSPGRAWPSSFRGGLPVDPYIPMVPDVPIGTDAPPRVTPPPARWLQYNRVHVLFQVCWPTCLASSTWRPRGPPRPSPTAGASAARDQRRGECRRQHGIGPIVQRSACHVGSAPIIAVAVVQRLRRWSSAGPRTSPTQLGIRAVKRAMLAIEVHRQLRSRLNYRCSRNRRWPRPCRR